MRKSSGKWLYSTFSRTKCTALRIWLTAKTKHVARGVHQQKGRREDVIETGLVNGSGEEYKKRIIEVELKYSMYAWPESSHYFKKIWGEGRKLQELKGGKKYMEERSRDDKSWPTVYMGSGHGDLERRACGGVRGAVPSVLSVPSSFQKQNSEVGVFWSSNSVSEWLNACSSWEGTFAGNVQLIFLAQFIIIEAGRRYCLCVVCICTIWISAATPLRRQWRDSNA